jgi:hypothetical protein
MKSILSAVALILLCASGVYADDVPYCFGAGCPAPDYVMAEPSPGVWVVEGPTIETVGLPVPSALDGFTPAQETLLNFFNFGCIGSAASCATEVEIDGYWLTDKPSFLDSSGGSGSPVSTPEPSTLLLFGSSMVMVGPLLAQKRIRSAR